VSQSEGWISFEQRGHSTGLFTHSASWSANNSRLPFLPHPWRQVNIWPDEATSLEIREPGMVSVIGSLQYGQAKLEFETFFMDSQHIMHSMWPCLQHLTFLLSSNLGNSWQTQQRNWEVSVREVVTGEEEEVVPAEEEEVVPAEEEEVASTAALVLLLVFTIFTFQIYDIVSDR